MEAKGKHDASLHIYRFKYHGMKLYYKGTYWGPAQINFPIISIFSVQVGVYFFTGKQISTARLFKLEINGKLPGGINYEHV